MNRAQKTASPSGAIWTSHGRDWLRELIAEYGPFVCRSLRYLRLRVADLDDAVQEVFLVVYLRNGEYEERGLRRAWLYSICLRVAKQIHRRRQREATIQLDQVGPVSEPTQLVSLEDREALALGRRLLDELPPAQREVFILYEIEDMSMPEVAEVLGCPLQTAHSRLHSARARVLMKVRQDPATAIRLQRSHGRRLSQPVESRRL